MREQLPAPRARGWAFRWFSWHGSRFNYDFHVSFDPATAPAHDSYRDADELAASVEWAWLVDHVGEQPGISTFLREGDDGFHTYSTYSRGVEVMMHAYDLLDLTALGRQEDCGQPAVRAPVLHSAAPGYMA